MRKSNNNWRILNIFSEIWSQSYNGQLYPRSGRDLKATKMFLELYPEFFEDETMQTAFRGWVTRYLEDSWWYKPNGEVPLCHEFCYFVNNLSKYSAVQRKIEVKKRVEREIMVQCDHCNNVHGALSPCPVEA